MSSFTIHLRSGQTYERWDHVVAFSGENTAGSFAILAHHERLMTFLDFGLAKIRFLSGEVQYLALPEALLYFAANELHLNTRAYVKSGDYREICRALEHQRATEVWRLHEIRKSLRQLDEEVLKRLLKARFPKG